MGLLDLFGGGSKVERLQKAATQKFGPPEGRQKALGQLSDLAGPEAITALLRRFTFAVDPSITDREEKEFTYRAIVDRGQDSVEPLKQFLKSSDTGVAWALKTLFALVTPTEVVGICIETLQKLGNDYTRDPEKKVVLLTQLFELEDERIAEAVIPFLEDPADDIKIAACKVLAKSNLDKVRAALVDGLVREHEKKRVQAAISEALATGNFKLDDTSRAKVTPLLSDSFAMEKDGTVKRKQ